MAHNVKGSTYHPARVSGHQKFLRAKAVNEELGKPKKVEAIEPLDISASGWSTKRKKRRKAK
jgi:hypothetical protein